MYLMVGTRPDLAYHMRDVSQFLANLACRHETLGRAPSSTTPPTCTVGGTPGAVGDDCRGRKSGVGGPDGSCCGDGAHFQKVR
ncbi:hypothetical protein PPTG_20628 [Phytophthora nicotianae INRA-310]|uniref:Uncharacterized protein n=1 Tax=Phytophthora nicotianae (strain INRA-310) TaxID=761204 RepID=W2RFU6_PHYN3|nr:hypothetical protein PPTG_20628 [Phytophthora nicotianae INRA-310]ETN23405.1 hypothetical protein PPTG_20628 [Phytophthora nicotianae INRA-310]